MSKIISFLIEWEDQTVSYQMGQYEMTTGRVNSRMNRWLLLLLLSIYSCGPCQSERILFLTSVSFKSHKISFMPIAEALAERGHQVTVITPFAADEKRRVDNLHEITVGNKVQNELGVDWFRMQKQNPISATLGLLNNLRSSAEAGYVRLMANEEFQTIMRTRSVDLVIVLAVLNDFSLPIIDHLKVPFIFFSATINVPWHLQSMGVEQNYAFIPGFGSHFNSEMTFTQRMINMIRIEILIRGRKLLLTKPLDQLIAKDFPKSRPISEMELEAQLSIINGKTTITWPRPLPPNVVTIGALHVRPAQPLAQVNFNNQN